MVRKQTRRKKNSERGISLTLVLLFLFILSISWISFSVLSGYEKEEAQSQRASVEATYLAEAGIQQALGGLASHPWWMTDTWWDTQFAGTRGVENGKDYFEWSGKLAAGDSGYGVKILDDGLISAKIIATGHVGAVQKTIEVELGSAFDFGLYSHDQIKLSSGFTVSGTNFTGYAYAKNGITNPNFLTADKKAGNYSTAPLFFPKEIPLPSLGTPQFQAKITGTPTATTVRYVDDSGEDTLEADALLRNKAKNNFRIVQSVSTTNNTITTAASNNDNWAAGDEIVFERIKLYEDEYTRLNDFVYASPPYTDAEFKPEAGNPWTTLPDHQQEFPVSPNSSAEFSAPTVAFYGDTTFNGTIKIDGDAEFGKMYNGSANTTINGDIIVKGSATIYSDIRIKGSLYVNGNITITGGSLSVDISPAAQPEKAVYLRNGSLYVGSYPGDPQNLSGGGKVIVGHDLKISNRLLADDPTQPMKIIAMGDMELGNNIGLWSSPFCGIIYCGGKIYHTNVWANPRTRIQGLLMAGTYYYQYPDNSEDKFFFSGYVTYDKDMKQDLPALGFTNNKDFVRPLLWRE